MRSVSCQSSGKRPRAACSRWQSVRPSSFDIGADPRHHEHRGPTTSVPTDARGVQGGATNAAIGALWRHVAYEAGLLLYATPRETIERTVTMCVVTMGLMLALAPAAIFFGLMIWRDGIGEAPPETDVRHSRQTMSLHQPASNSR
jgi:hypothetical protein